MGLSRASLDAAALAQGRGGVNRFGSRPQRCRSPDNAFSRGQSCTQIRIVVLDSSALLCLLQAEPGAERVAETLATALVSAVNVAETVGKLREAGLSAAEVRDVLGSLPLDVRPFTDDRAHAAGALRLATRALGLSLGDRACLALALETNALALTTDRRWLKLDVGVAIEALR